MNKFLSIIFSFICCEGFSQSGYFSQSDKSQKYFVSFGYGVGTAKWNSTFKNTNFYDKDGAIISSGDFSFTAISPTRHYDLNVSAPFKKIRLGMGISFEKHYLSELKFYDKNGEEILLFDENLRFDKMFLFSEVPIKFNSSKKYSFNWDLRLGWFGYSYIERYNFIGEKSFPVCVLAATGVTFDYEIYPKVFVFAFPNFEYKYYDNSHTEAPVSICHKVYTASILSGIRVNFASR